MKLPKFSPAALLALASTAFAASPLDHGIDTVMVPPSIARDFTPRQWSLGGESLWARGSSESNSVDWVVRFDATGRVAANAQFYAFDEITDIRALSADTALLLGYDVDDDCIVALVDADLEARWIYQTNVEHTSFRNLCGVMAAGSVPEAALVQLPSQTQALRFDADGHPVRLSSQGGNSAFVRATQRLSDGSVVLGSTVGSGSNAEKPTVVMFDPFGQLRWIHRVSRYEGYRVLGFSERANGELGVVLSGPMQAIRLTLTPQGTELSAVAVERGAETVGFANSAQGGSLFLDFGRPDPTGPEISHALHLLPDGSVQRFNLPAGRYWLSNPVSLSNGHFVAAFTADDNRYVLLRFAPGQAAREIAAVHSDGSVEINAIGNDLMVSRRIGGDTIWQRYREDGSQVPAPETGSALATCGLATFQSATTADGSAFVLSHADVAQWLSAVDPDDRILWTVAFPDGRIDQLSVDADRVCALGGEPKEIRCFARASGTMVQQLPASTVQAMTSLPNGTLNVLGQHAAGVYFDNIDRAGVVRRELVQGASSGRLSFLSDGRGAVQSTVAGSARLIVLRADGTEQFRYTMAGASSQSQSVVPSGDGGVLIRGITPIAVTALSPLGELRWQVTGTQADGFFGASAVGDKAVLVRGDIGYRLGNFGARAPRETRIEVRGLGDGEIRWTQTVVRPAASGLQIVPSPQSSDILLLSDDWSGSRIWRFDAGLGHLAEHGRLDCDAPFCGTASAWVDQRQRLNFVRADSRPRCGWTLERKQLAPATPTIAVAQAGLAGVWYSPSADGQGLFVQYSPGNRTLFMPWFTYAMRGLNQREDLRWYSLQGIVAAHAREATLQISRNTNGNFNAPPLTDAIAVGSASFRLSDCNRGTLDYRIEAPGEEPVSGSLALQRLAGGFSDCQTHAGIIPGADARPSANGFDMSQSGAWFQPEFSGQGVMLSVQPPTADATGLLFGAWFTYDPVGAGDDPTAQHWFSMVGQTSHSGPPGQTRVTLLRTLGGDIGQQSTDNTWRVGEADLLLQGCTLTLNYRFDNSALAGAFRGLTGRMNAVPVAGCTP